MRFKFLAVGCLALVTSLFFQVANAATQQPEEFVRQFYQWYIQADKADQPVETSDGIYKYVAKATADRIRAEIKRGGLPGDVAYFTKVQDYDPAEWQANMDVHHAVMLTDGVALVAVTFGKQEKVDVVLFLKQQQDHWQIIKAVDTLPWP